MESNPGWSLDSAQQGRGWEWGIPTGGGGSRGYPDPTAGFTGSRVIGYNLAGDYPANMSATEWATTPAINAL